ncbi:ceramidase domain-containing protein [Rhabdaerophilum sp.]|uniref:ceramidase domain-containing protein n=1 Tax=Rhabdaerophilum sp. TaxID=2717341 RepID=UPI0038D3991A
MFQVERSFLAAYCERSGDPSFWAEPLNAITNAGFLLAALLGLRLLRGGRDVLLACLSGLAFAIGVGSFLFHTIPNRITVMLDVLPIQGFILLYLGLALRRYLTLPLWAALLGPVLFFLGSSALVSAFGSRALGGGIGYVPALAALFGVALLAWLKSDAASRLAAAHLAGAGVLFAISLTLRTLDRPLCGMVPLGLHFLWHLLNATVLAVLLLSLARHRRMQNADSAQR